MVKQLVIIGVVVSALIVGGVLQVRVHPQEVRHLPARVGAFLSNPELQASLRVGAVGVKRWAEQLLARDEEKKLELALLYVQQDAEQLQMLQAKEDPSLAALIVQTELLNRSLSLAETSLRVVPVETALKMKDRSQSSVTHIKEALEKLREQREAQKELGDTLAEAVQGLEEKYDSFAAIAGSGNPQSSVSGANTTAGTPAPNNTPSALPLTF